MHLLELRLSPDGDRPLPAETDNLFAILPWTHCTLNEGSSMHGYAEIDLHYRLAPSAFPTCQVGRPHSQLSSLVSFDYIAIYPMYGQYAKVLGLLFKLPNLERIRMQLADKHRSRTDRDMKLEPEYFYTAKYFVENLTKSSINEFICWDYQHEGLWEGLDHGDEKITWHWQALGPGHWRK
jgi:hypothetical protein